jgi:hypothetical protein
MCRTGSGQTANEAVPRWTARPFHRCRHDGRHTDMSILWIILIVILVLALLGFFGRGRF